jgi:hypothetical protein
MAEMKVMLFKKSRIRVDENGLVCINDIYTAAGFSKNQSPADWIQLIGTKKEIGALIKKKTGKTGLFTKNDVKSVMYSKKGPGGGIWVDENLALGYAAYLSATLAVEIRDVFLRFKKGDETLVSEIRANRAKRDPVFEQHREIGKRVRRTYTDTLKEHGVKQGFEYAHCTNELYKHLHGGTAKELKISRRLNPKANLRDHMSLSEIAYTMASEALAAERIEEQDANGFSACRVETRLAATTIRAALESDRKNRQRKISGL